ncbi:hypothetical protein [Dactylosporangium sp. NPDC000521]|uniref:hypothetical protein n=1 Tax=Dactylosporangium sp. NPDC000521 TaxID=3363975 RepID=UPI003680AC35
MAALPAALVITVLDAGPGPTTVAEPGHGRFTVVVYDRGHRTYVLRTTGPLGREGRTDVAGTAARGVQVRAVRFPDGRQVGVSPGSLRPARVLDRCTR